MEEEKECKINKELKNQVEEKIGLIVEQGLQEDTLDILGKLVDIHKDLCNENYWKKKEEVMKMRYRGYEGYGEGDYGEGGYGRRGRRGRYSERGGNYAGEEIIEELHEHYGNYMDGGRYNGPEKDKSFDYMLKTAEDFFAHLMEEAERPEQMEKIKKTARKISEMRM